MDVDPLYGDEDVRFGFLLEMRIGEARNGDGLYGDIFVGEWVMVLFSLVGLCWVVIRRPGLLRVSMILPGLWWVSIILPGL